LAGIAGRLDREGGSGRGRTAYVLFDAAVSYRWGPVAAQVNLKNLGNAKYFTGNNSFVLPGEPFTVLGQLTWRFP
jgi:outer membrane receptor for ferric coprogen and ferric-rhodotorulic acid